MRVANDVLATFPGHAVKRGLPHQCAVGLGPRVLHSGYQHGGTRWPVSSRCFATKGRVGWLTPLYVKTLLQAAWMIS